MSIQSPSIVSEFDATVYLVLDDFGELGRAYVEAEEEHSDLKDVIESLLKGEYSNPLRVIAFNTAQGWSRDVSEDVANQVLDRALREQDEVPLATAHFIGRHLDLKRVVH